MRYFIVTGSSSRRMQAQHDVLKKSAPNSGIQIYEDDTEDDRFAISQNRSVSTSALPLNEAVNKENAEGPTIWKGNQVGAILIIGFRHLSDILLGFPFAFMGAGGGLPLPVLGSYVFRVT